MIGREPPRQDRNGLHFFFYGTLMDEDVLRAVVGPKAYAFVEPAVLPGWRRASVPGASYPMVVRAHGSGVQGVLAWGFDAIGRDRMIAYEGDEYVLTRLPVIVRGKRIEAHVFVPRLDRPVRVGGPWDLATWQRRSKPAFLRALRAWRAGMQRQARAQTKEQP